MTVSDYLQYSGPIFAGDDNQGGSDLKIGYDTQSVHTIIPSASCTSCSSNWFNASTTTSGTLVYSSDHYTLTTGMSDQFSVTCETAYGQICLSNEDLRGEQSNCVQQEFCLATGYTTHP